MSPIKWQCFFHYFPNTHFLLKFTRPSVECFLEIYIVASHLYNSNFKICCKLHNFVFFGKENLFTRRERNKTLNIIPFRFNVAGVKKQIKYLFESPWSKGNVHISSQILPVRLEPKNIIFWRRLSHALYPLILPNNYGIISNKSRLRLFSL